jgi:hypothetical protein
MSQLAQFNRSRAAVDPFGKNPEAAQEYERQKAALNERAKKEWDDPAFHRSIAADVASILDYQFTFENLFGSYFQVENVGQFDRVILRERRGLKVFYTSRGGYIEESQLKREDWELPRDTLGFHVSEHTDKLQANFAETIEDMVSLGSARMEAEINRRMFNLLQEAVPSSSPYYVAAAGLTKTALDTAIREVKDAIKPNGVGPLPVTIIGRASMVDQISDFNLGFDPEATEEIRAKGRLGVYRAANIVQVINYTDENGLPYIPANELWVFGGTVGKFAMYGGTTAKSWEENTVDYRHYRTRRDIGGLVHHPEQARRIVDSTVTEV